jgi:hypothetical protein
VQDTDWSAGQACLSRGRRDRFVVSAADVGPRLQGVVVSLAPPRYSSPQPHSGWFLASLEVLHAPSGTVTTFRHDAWLDPPVLPAAGAEVADDSRAAAAAVAKVLLEPAAESSAYVDYTITVVSKL